MRLIFLFRCIVILYRTGMYMRLSVINTINLFFLLLKFPTTRAEVFRCWFMAFGEAGEGKNAIKQNKHDGGDEELNANPHLNDPASIILMNEYKHANTASKASTWPR